MHKKRQPKWIGQLDLLTALAGVIVVTTLVVTQPFTLTEEQFFNWVYGWPSSWQSGFIIITQLGSVWTLCLLTLLVVVVKKSRTLALKFFSVVALTYISALLLKMIVGRPRPYLVLNDVSQKDTVGTADYGYPSGHAAMAIAVALLILPLIPKNWRWLLSVMVIAVGLSRLYLGVHFPLDVAGGYLLGWLMVSVVEFQHKLLAKPPAKA